MQGRALFYPEERRARSFRPPKSRIPSLRIRTSGKYRERPVNLLGKHDTRQLMGKRHRAERQFLPRPLAKHVGETIRIASNKDQLACAPVALFGQPFGKSLRTEILAGGIKENDRRGPIRIHFLDGRRSIAHFRNLDRRVTLDALHIVVKHSAHLGTPGLAEHEQLNLHFSSYFFRFSSSVLRLIPRISDARPIL